MNSNLLSFLSNW